MSNHAVAIEPLLHSHTMVYHATADCASPMQPGHGRSYHSGSHATDRACSTQQGQGRDRPSPAEGPLSPRRATADKASSEINMASSVQPCHGRARRSCASRHGQPYPLCMAMLWSGTSFRRGRGTVDRASPAQSRHGRASLDLAKSHHNCETTPGHRAAAASTQPYYGLSRHCRLRFPHAAMPWSIVPL